jgi:voltage-gated potassium channel
MEAPRVATIIRAIYRAVTDLHWSVLAGAVLLHLAAAWFLMGLAGETELLEPAAFLYWYVTTASTVGYGDLAPATKAGRLLTAFFVFPGAIAAFTTVIAKTLAGLSGRWRRRRMGLADYRSEREHIVLVGYEEQRTPRMIDELVADADPDQDLILLARREMVNEDDRIRYVRARSLTAREDLQRAGVPTAARVIVFASNDEETLAAALAIAAMNRGGHIVCFFQEEENARLLTAHCPNVEVVLAPSVELVVKAVKDPGSSHLLHILASHTEAAATLFSVTWPGKDAPFGDVTSHFLRYGAVPVSWRPAGGARSDFRFDTTGTISSGDRIFYVADRRLTADALAS